MHLQVLMILDIKMKVVTEHPIIILETLGNKIKIVMDNNTNNRKLLRTLRINKVVQIC